MKIEKIKVYDPKRDGLDALTFKDIYFALEARNRVAAYCLNDGLYERVLNSQVAPDLTLKGFLFGKEGYLFSAKNAVIVAFMDGKFHSKFVGSERGQFMEDLERKATENNSIPFTFSYDPAIDEYLRVREATDRVRPSA